MIYGNRAPFDGNFPSGAVVVPTYKEGMQLIKSIAAEVAPWARSYPQGALLFYDADVDYDSEVVGMGHTFNSSILSPQYQLNADGSYTNVGTGPAVDVFDGEKWLRSCGAVTNLLPSGAEDLTSWNKSQANVAASGLPTPYGGEAYRISATSAVASHRVYKRSSGSAPGTYTVSGLVKKDTTRYVAVTLSSSSEASRLAARIDFDLKKINLDNGTGQIALEELRDGWFLYTITGAVIEGDGFATSFIYVLNNSGVQAYAGDGESVLAGGIQLTQTAYPVPYTPPGTTMPASNATATNGCWFTLNDGSPVWKALDGEPDGVELVTNGGFDVDTSGWNVVGASATLSLLNGEAVITRGSATSYIYQEIENLTVGSRYLVSIDCATIDAQTVVTKLGTTAFGGEYVNNSYTNTALDNKRVLLTATSTTLYVAFQIGGSVEGSKVKVDNISIQRIKPQPLTFATRVRMGVGSADLVATAGSIIHYAYAGVNYVQYSYKGGGAVQVVTSFDGTTGVSAPLVTWPRNAIINRVTQVNTAGTQFRVGCMIEGADTTIQWSSWAAYDGSFGPSTLYRLMLGYNNAYPMWFSRIAVWNKQMDDSAILEALNG